MECTGRTTVKPVAYHCEGNLDISADVTLNFDDSPLIFEPRPYDSTNGGDIGGLYQAGS